MWLVQEDLFKCILDKTLQNLPRSPEQTETAHHLPLPSTEFAMREIKCWFVQSEVTLLDMLIVVDCDMFHLCIDNINKFVDVVVSSVIMIALSP